MIIFRCFTRPRFDDAMVVRSNDWAFSRQVYFGGVLGPCCLRGEGVVTHGKRNKRERSNLGSSAYELEGCSAAPAIRLYSLLRLTEYKLLNLRQVLYYCTVK